MRYLKCNAGFTLVEMMVTIAVLAITLAIAVPSFQNFINKGRLVGAAEQVSADLKYARSEALQRNRLTSISFKNIGTGTAWCYGIDDDSSTACDCSAATSNCTVGGVEKKLTNDGFSGVSITSVNFIDNKVCIDPQRGVVSSGAGCASTSGGTATLTSTSGTLHVVTSVLGRVKICTPTADDKNKLGYPRC